MEAFDRLVRTETVLWNLLEGRLLTEGRAGLGTLQALRVLKHHDGRGRVEDLRRELSITNGATSKLVDRMQRAGLVSRTAHPDDRRSSLIVLTDSGEAEAAAGAALTRSFIEQVISEEDAAALVPLLARIERHAAPPVDSAS